MGSLNNAFSYVINNCTWWVAENLPWVPAGLGNAKDWLANAQRKGFGTSSTPTPGSVVVYGPGHGYDPNYGHVAVVKSVQPGGRFTVSEMSYGVASTRTSTMTDVLGFIIPPGSAATLTSAPSASSSAPNPITDPGGYAAWIVSQSSSGIANALNPANWLLSLWNDHLKGQMMRVALIIVGIVLLFIGIRILFASEIPTPGPMFSAPTSPDAATSGESTQPAKGSEGEAAEGASAEDAAVVAA